MHTDGSKNSVLKSEKLLNSSPSHSNLYCPSYNSSEDDSRKLDPTSKILNRTKLQCLGLESNDLVEVKLLDTNLRDFITFDTRNVVESQEHRLTPEQ